MDFYKPRKLIFKAWNVESRLLMRLDSFESVRGELQKSKHILLQFTGVHDKQGEQLYEMDVVLIDTSRYVIRWNERTSGWCFESESDPGNSKPLTVDSAKQMSRLCSWFESEKEKY